MKSLFSLFLFATCSFAAAGNTLTPASGSVGHNLQTYATVALSAPADSDVTMTVTSSDPSRLLIAKHPEAKGSASITVTVRAKYRESPEFWLQALGSSGDVPYSVTIPGFEPGKGTVTLAPSGIAISGPNGANIPVFTTTPRSWPSKLAVKASRLDPSLKPVDALRE